MSKRKRARSTKTRSVRVGAVRRQTAHHHQTRANSKQARVLALLRGPNGATIATVMRSTGWQPHTVRGFLAAVVRKKLGLKLESNKTDGKRVYRIVGGGNSDSGLRAELVEHLVGRKVLDPDHEVLAQRAKFVRQPPIGCIRNHLDDVERPLFCFDAPAPTERDRLHGW